MMKMKDIPGYEGLYSATIDGEIWSHRQKKFMKPGYCSSGYKQVTLFKNNHRKNMTVHKIVWITYKGEIPPGLEINHIDEDKNNNSLDNLELCTRRYNLVYGTRTIKQSKKLEKPFILTDVESNEELHFDSLRACAEAFKIKIKSVADGRNKMFKRGDWRVKHGGKTYLFSWK